MQKAIYTTVGIDELLAHVQALKGAGARFVDVYKRQRYDREPHAQAGNRRPDPHV